MRFILSVILFAPALANAQTGSLTAVEREQFYDGYGFGPGAKFGRDILLDGSRAIVLNGSSTPPEEATEYRLIAGSWTFQAFTPLVSMIHAFGGHLLLKGDPYFLSGPGRVAVERRAPSGWSYTYLLNPELVSGTENFGYSLDIDGSTVVIGNPLRTRNFFHEGSVHIYEDTGTSLVLVHSFYGGAPNRRLGWNVRVDGDDCVAMWVNGSSADFEAFRRQAGAWTQVQSSFGMTNLTFGRIELGDGLAIVPEQTQVYVWFRSDSGWSFDSILPPIPSAHPIFELAVADGVIAVAQAQDDTAGTDAGAVYLFARNDGWKLQTRVTASDAHPGDQFGTGLDLDTHRLLVGAPWDDDVANDLGAVYDFDLIHDPARVHCVPEKSSLGCVARMGFSGTPSASGSAAFLVTASNVTSHKFGVLLYGTTGRLFLPFPGGVRCVAPPRRTTSRQSSGGTSGVDDCSGTLSIEFNALVRSGTDPLLFAGQQVEGQWIFRDPSGPSAIASSEAIEFRIGP